MAWDEDKKAKAVEMYESREPTPENSMEIVKEIAEELDESPNGVRNILSREGVYVKIAPAAGSGKSTSKSGGGGRVSKEEQHQRLREAIESLGGEVQDDIITKLTGKAAAYLADVITGSSEDEE